MKKLFIIFIFVFSSCTLPSRVGYDQSYYSKSNNEKALFHLELALNSFGQNRYFKAEKHGRLAHFYLPQSRKIKFNLAAILLASEQFRESEEIILSLIKSEPTNKKYYLLLANSSLQQKNYLNALDNYQKALKLTNDKEKQAKERILRNISELYFNLGYEEDALCFSNLSKSYIDNLNIKSHLALLSALNRSSSIVFSENILEQAKQMRDEEILFWFALAKYDLGDFSDSFFLAKIIQSELIAEGNIPGFIDFYKLVDKKVNYAVDKDSEYEFSLNELQRIYWPITITTSLVKF